MKITKYTENSSTGKDSYLTIIKKIDSQENKNYKAILKYGFLKSSREKSLSI